jgi:hypothetical protein
MEIRRVASNEEFIRKIILSIDNDYSNLAINRSSFHRFFREKLSDTGNATEAIEYAKEKLQRVVEKRNSPLNKKIKSPESVEIVKKPTSYDLQKETSALNIESKEKRRQEILDLLKAKSGFEDEETLKLLYKKFIGVKNSRNLSDDSTAERVIFQYKEDIARNTPEEPIVPPTEEEIIKAARILQYLDPKNASANLSAFKRYLEKYGINDAFHFTQNIIKYRQFLNDNGLKLDQVTTKIFDQYGKDFEKAIEVIKQRQMEGAMPIESRVLNKTKTMPSEANEALVDFEGRKVPLYRVLQRVYPNMHYSSFKKSYSTILNLIFLKGYTLDEAIAQNNKENLVNRNKSMFQKEFPEDPDQAEMIFESYYIDEGYTFEEALEKTKQDIYGNRRTSAKYKIRIK